MRRLALALALLLAASPAWALRAAFIFTNPNSANPANGDRILQALVTNGMASYRDATYDMYPDIVVNSPALNQALRRGKIFLAGRSDTLSYDLIVHVGYATGAYSGNPNPYYRPDSLWKFQNYPKVTQLFIGNYFAGGSIFTQSTSCSTGVGGQISYTADKDSTQNHYVVGKPWLTWKSYAKFPVQATRNPKGWRPLIGVVSTRHIDTNDQSADYDQPWDGNPASTNPDSVSAWAVMNWDTSTTTADTLYGVHKVFGGVVHSFQNPIGGDAKPCIAMSPNAILIEARLDCGEMFAVLQYADSVSGGALFGTTEPMKIGLHIDDGWKRGDSQSSTNPVSYGGIVVADSSTFIATIDSLAALGIKFVVGVETDSVTDKANFDDRWWRRAPLAHFTPHSHEGLTNSETTRPQNVGTPYLRGIDAWGLSSSRVRRFYPVTGACTAVIDSECLYCIAKRQFAIIDSMMPGKTDHIAMPPGDDWTPNQITRGDATGLDSLYACATIAGYRGIRCNSAFQGSQTVFGVNIPTANTGQSEFFQTYVVRGRGNSGPGGGGLPSWIGLDSLRFSGREGLILPCDSYPTGAGIPAGSGAAYSYQSNHTGHNFLTGALTGRTLWNSYNQATSSSVTVTPIQTRYRIAVCHASDLCGNGRGTGGTSVPTRPMYYKFKYLWAITGAMQAFSRNGYGIVQIDYPENIRW